MWRLTGRIQHYAWGSTSLIDEFVGLPCDARPDAEVWYGAHPSAPAYVSPASPWAEAVAATDAVAGKPQPTSLSLVDVVEADPATVLGEANVKTFGPRLPYLAKLLAAAQPLSLQAHPTLAQAQAGFAREEAAGTPSELRNYSDDQHKPETLTALTPMRALAGFRQPEDIARDLTRLGAPALSGIIATLRTAGDDAAGQEHPGASNDLTDGATARLARAFPAVLRLPQESVIESLQALRSLALTPVPALTPDAALTSETAQSDQPGTWGDDALVVAREILDFYPEDVGVLAAIFLNPVLLAPGQALSVTAGVVHCYLKGLGFEVMSSSNNVLRAGLTPKRVDIEELTRILDFAPSAPVIDDPVVEKLTSLTRRGYRPTTSEYAVAFYDVTEGALAPIAEASGPRLVVGLEGAVLVSNAQDRSAITAGDAVFAGDGERISLSGMGRVAIVAVPATSV